MIVMLGETLKQRTGIINLGVEGEMLMGACVGFAVAAATGNPPLLGLLAGAIAGAILSTGSCRPRARRPERTRSDPVLAVWMIGLGLTSYFGGAMSADRSRHSCR